MNQNKSLEGSLESFADKFLRVPIAVDQLKRDRSYHAPVAEGHKTHEIVARGDLGGQSQRSHCLRKRWGHFDATYFSDHPTGQAHPCGFEYNDCAVSVMGSDILAKGRVQRRSKEF